MDWAKAKNILIAAFVALNIYLLVQLINLQEARIPVSEYTSINEQVNNLVIEKYQVEPPAELPLGIFPVEKPSVSVAKTDKEDIIASLWPNNEGEWTEENLYQHKEEYLYLDDKVFYYLNEAGGVREIVDDKTIKHHLELALEDSANTDIVAPILRVSFEEVTSLNFEGWLLESITETIEEDILYYDILFIQELGLPVYDAQSYTKIRINEKGHIIGIKRAKLQVKELEKNFVDKVKSLLKFSTKVKIISANEALLSFVANEDLEIGSVIKDIRLAYLGLEEELELADQVNPSLWNLIPVWRLKLIQPSSDTIQNYYLNAYTGEIERH